MAFRTPVLNTAITGKTTFDGGLTATVDIKNTITVPGKEVVQLYANAPEGKPDKPEKGLVAFAKTVILP